MMTFFGKSLSIFGLISSYPGAYFRFKLLSISLAISIGEKYLICLRVTLNGWHYTMPSLESMALSINTHSWRRT